MIRYSVFHCELGDRALCSVIKCHILYQPFQITEKKKKSKSWKNDVKMVSTVVWHLNAILVKEHAQSKVNTEAINSDVYEQYSPFLAISHASCKLFVNHYLRKKSIHIEWCTEVEKFLCPDRFSPKNYKICTSVFFKILLF